MTACAAVDAAAEVRRIDIARVAEAQVVGFVTTRSSRPVVAAITDIAHRTVVAAAIARGRVPDSQVCSEISGEVHAQISAIISSCVIF